MEGILPQSSSCLIAPTLCAGAERNQCQQPDAPPPPSVVPQELNDSSLTLVEGSVLSTADLLQVQSVGRGGERDLPQAREI